MLNLFRRRHNPKTEGLPEHRLTHVRTLKSGVKYYTFDNPLYLPAIRQLALEEAKRMYDARVTREALLRYVDDMEAAINTGKIVEAATILGELKLRTQLKLEKETLLAIADVFFIRQGEDVYSMSDAMREKKRAEWEGDRDALGFFLQQVVDWIGSLPNWPKELLLSYLEDIDREIKVTRVHQKPTESTPPPKVTKPFTPLSKRPASVSTTPTTP